MLAGRKDHFEFDDDDKKSIGAFADYAAVALENLKMYKKHNLIKKIKSTSKIFEEYYQKILEIDVVGDIRHKGMLLVVLRYKRGQ